MKRLLTAGIAALLFSASYAQEDQAGDDETAVDTHQEIDLNTTTPHSNCKYKGHIVRVSVYPELQDSYVYLRSHARSHVLYQAKVDDERLLNAAYQGLNSSVYVQIKTNHSCVSGGGSNERYVGYIDRLVLNP